MSVTLLTKRTTTAGKAPAAADLSVGELAVNVADAKLYTKKNDGTVALLNPPATVSISVLSFDFGSVPLPARTFTVNVPGATLGTEVLCSVSGDQSNGSAIDELEFEPLLAFGRVSAADTLQFTIVCANVGGYTSGVKYINFTVG